MTAFAAKLSPAARAEILRLYDSGDYSKRQLGAMFGVSREAIISLIKRTDRRASEAREPKGPALTVLGERLLRVREMVRCEGRLRWWPGVETDCSRCGGRLMLHPPADSLGYVYCLLCAHEPYTVAP